MAKALNGQEKSLSQLTHELDDALAAYPAAPMIRVWRQEVIYSLARMRRP